MNWIREHWSFLGWITTILLWIYREVFWRLRDDHHIQDGLKQLEKTNELAAEHNELLKKNVLSTAERNAIFLKSFREAQVYTAGKGFNPITLRMKVDGTTVWFLDCKYPPTFICSMSADTLTYQKTGLSDSVRIFPNRWVPSINPREINQWDNISG